MRMCIAEAKAKFSKPIAAANEARRSRLRGGQPVLRLVSATASCPSFRIALRMARLAAFPASWGPCRKTSSQFGADDSLSRYGHRGLKPVSAFGSRSRRTSGHEQSTFHLAPSTRSHRSTAQGNGQKWRTWSASCRSFTRPCCANRVMGSLEPIPVGHCAR